MGLLNHQRYVTYTPKVERRGKHPEKWMGLEENFYFLCGIRKNNWVKCQCFGGDGYRYRCNNGLICVKRVCIYTQHQNRIFCILEHTSTLAHLNTGIFRFVSMIA